MDRRRFLGRVGLLACLGFAGCAGSEGGTTRTTDEAATTTDPTPSPTATAEPTRTETRTAAPTATATETETATQTATRTPTPTETPSPTPTPEPAPSSVTVAVGPDDRLRFHPETFEVAVGGTVTWEWESDSHNVGVSAQPDGADWPAHDETLYDTGHTYSYTFEVSGEYDYYCSPHRGAGMVGSFTVR
jgi:plastocyanin